MTELSGYSQASYSERESEGLFFLFSFFFFLFLFYSSFLFFLFFIFYFLYFFFLFFFWTHFLFLAIDSDWEKRREWRLSQNVQINAMYEELSDMGPADYSYDDSEEELKKALYDYQLRWEEDPAE